MKLAERILCRKLISTDTSQLTRLTNLSLARRLDASCHSKQKRICDLTRLRTTKNVHVGLNTNLFLTINSFALPSDLCAICNKGFRTNRSLKRHEAVHSRSRLKIRSFRCQKCELCFALEKDFTSHLKSHHGN